MFKMRFIEEREQGIRQIERDMADVNSMFIDLADMVNEQAPLLGMIS